MVYAENPKLIRLDHESSFRIENEEEMPDVWRISSRSDGRWVNVNDLLNPLGGGGHAGAAGMMKKTDKPELLLEAILKQAEAMIKQKENVG